MMPPLTLKDWHGFNKWSCKQKVENSTLLSQSTIGRKKMGWGWGVVNEIGNKLTHHINKWHKYFWHNTALLTIDWGENII